MQTCDTTGSAEVITVAMGVVSDYSYRWYTGLTLDSTTELTSGSGAQISGLDPAEYSVIAIDDSTGCESNPVAFVIEALYSSFTIEVTASPQTSCDPANPGGDCSALRFPGVRCPVLRGR